MKNPTDTPSKQRTATKIAYQNPWITVHEDTTVDTHGDNGVYGYIESHDSCMVVVVDDAERIYLIRGFRYPSQSFGWMLPGGGGEGENLVEASKRELEEETGILAKSWEKLGEAYVCNGLLTEKMTVCLARDLSFNGAREISAETFSDMQFFTLKEVNQLILNGEINDCQTLAGLQYYTIWQKEQI